MTYFPFNHFATSKHGKHLTCIWGGDLFKKSCFCQSWGKGTPFDWIERQSPGWLLIAKITSGESNVLLKRARFLSPDYIPVLSCMHRPPTLGVMWYPVVDSRDGNAIFSSSKKQRLGFKKVFLFSSPFQRKLSDPFGWAHVFLPFN